MVNKIMKKVPKKDFKKNPFNPEELSLQDEFEREKDMERDPFNPEYGIKLHVAYWCMEDDYIDAFNPENL